MHDFADILGNQPVLLLRPIATPQVHVMEPASHRPIHEQPGRRSQRQHLSGTLLGHTQIQKVLVGSHGSHHSLSRDVITLLGQIIPKIADAVLSVLGVLSPHLWQLWH